MTYQHERDEFLLKVGPVLGLGTATMLLRHASTLQRLAVAQCNGDYPADNGERKVVPCPLCESQWVPSQITGGRLAQAALSYRLAEVQWDRDQKPREYLLSISLVVTKACPDCRTEAAVRLLLEGSPYQAITGGDPRGYVLALYSIGADRAAIDRGMVQGIGVPSRER